MSRLLLVDEDPKTLNILSTLIRTEGYKVVPVLGLDKCMSFVKSQAFDLMILDICGRFDKGVELLRLAHQERADLPILALRDPLAVERRDELATLPFAQWLEKPFKVDEFLRRIQQMVDFQNLPPAEAGGAPAPMPAIEMVHGLQNIVARSQAMRAVCDMIKRVAPTELTILLLGEPGTDKEQVARAIHEQSLRKGKSFVAFDCGAAPDEAALALKIQGAAKSAGQPDQPGVFENGREGTVFLDRVEALPATLQETVFRIVQEKKVRRQGGRDDLPVNARLIVATHQDPAKKTPAGAWHEGFQRMIGLMPIVLKPLRECKEDIAPLVDQFLSGLPGADGGLVSCGSDTIGILEAYRWPRNTAELREALQYAVAHADGHAITPRALPPDILLVAQKAARA